MALAIVLSEPAGPNALKPREVAVGEELWNNPNTAMLEDYGRKDGQLYHPDAVK